MDYTVHGNLQARILEWVAFPFFSRASSQPRAPTQVSRVAGRFLTSGAKGDKGKAKNASQLATGPEIARKSPLGHAQTAKQTGHWKRDCPQSGRRNGVPTPEVAILTD